MEFDTLFGKNLLPEFNDLSTVKELVASELDGDCYDVVGVYRLDGVTMGDVMEQLKNTGYEESSTKGLCSLMLVDEETLTVKDSAYFS